MTDAPDDEFAVLATMLGALADDADLPTTKETDAELKRIRAELHQLWSDVEAHLSRLS